MSSKVSTPGIIYPSSFSHLGLREAVGFGAVSLQHHRGVCRVFPGDAATSLYASQRQKSDYGRDAEPFHGSSSTPPSTFYTDVG